MTQWKGKGKGKGCVVDDDGGHHPIVFRDLTPRVRTFEYRPEFEKKCAPCDFRLADEKMEMRSIHSCPTGLRPAPPEAGGRGIGGDSLLGKVRFAWARVPRRNDTHEVFRASRTDRSRPV